MAKSLSERKGNGGGGRDYTKAPLLEDDIYPARLVQYIGLGTQEQKPYKGTPKDPVEMAWVTYELVDVFCLDESGNEDEEKPRWMSERFPLYSLDSDRAKSTLRFNSLDPKNVTKGHLERCLGFPCQVDIRQSDVKNKTGHPYENIQAVTKVGRRVVVPELVNPTLLFDWDEPDLEVFESLPDFLKEMIMGAVDYEGSELDKLRGSTGTSQSKKSASPPPDDDDEDEEYFDEDDIPF